MAASKTTSPTQSNNLENRQPIQGDVSHTQHWLSYKVNRATVMSVLSTAMGITAFFNLFSITFISNFLDKTIYTFSVNHIDY
jgi:hypothetical protein